MLIESRVVFFLPFRALETLLGVAVQRLIEANPPNIYFLAIYMVRLNSVLMLTAFDLVPHSYQLQYIYTISVFMLRARVFQTNI